MADGRSAMNVALDEPKGLRKKSNIKESVG